ncbi:OmpA family protein [Frigidibacter oleivorans]|uniref:OmpA family protein n=1 Tax=Frigidibacter oleivorans TaxID=2487129 RepID=UPI000F8CCD77|nr:OmpA family protein [Frigidibacter oleivorans]
MAAFSILPAAVEAQTVRGERAAPTIWVDPDGCEHWVMDDGWEGYMDARIDSRGLPVCNRGEACGVMPTDQLFATDSAAISAEGRRQLQQFFAQHRAGGYVVAGHTDSRASDAYNLDLSRRRALAVASVAQSTGARVVSVDWYGERKPRASNATAAGMQQNRRVEIFCIR